jgi:hypothetical protein
MSVFILEIISEQPVQVYVEVGDVMTINDYGTKSTVDWADLGREMWTFLTGQKAQIDYQFVDMTIEVPRDTGANAPRATWRVDGTVRISSNRP